MPPLRSPWESRWSRTPRWAAPRPRPHLPLQVARTRAMRTHPVTRATRIHPATQATRTHPATRATRTRVCPLCRSRPDRLRSPLPRLTTLPLPPSRPASTITCRTRLSPVVDTLTWTVVMATRKVMMESVNPKIGYVALCFLGPENRLTGYCGTCANRVYFFPVDQQWLGLLPDHDHHQ